MSCLENRTLGKMVREDIRGLESDADPGVRAAAAAAPTCLDGAADVSTADPALSAYMLRQGLMGSDHGLMAGLLVSAAEGDQGDPVPRDVRHILRELCSPSAWTRALGVCEVVGTLAPDVATVCQVGRLIGDPSPLVRQVAAGGVAQIGPRALADRGDPEGTETTVP